jgi:hypothetical protein
MALKNFTKIRKTRKLESIHEHHFVERKNEGRNPDSNWRKFEFMPRNLDLKWRSRIPSRNTSTSSPIEQLR